MLSVREIQQQDISSIIHYWTSASDAFLRGMGADITKLPAPDAWVEMLTAQMSAPYEQKLSYCTIWEVDGEAAGHCNVTNVIFGKEAYMHLHMWKPDIRKQGNGAGLVRLSLPYFFHNLKLEMLHCAPYALNPAPNKTLERVGFRFVKQYIGTPGSISFEQEVNLWEMSREMFEGLSTTSFMALP